MYGERHGTANYLRESAARPWRGVVALADRQHGVVSLGQLIAFGINERTVHYWVASRRLQRIHSGVFIVGHSALRSEGNWMAAVLACGPGAALSHRPAGALQELCSPPGGRVDVTVPRRAGRSRSGIRVHSGDRLFPDEVTEVGNIRCTNVSRTILDLAAVLDRRGLERVCERASRVERFDAFELGALLARHRGRRGAGRLRGVLADWDSDLANTSSELEARFLRLVVATGIERPIVNGLIQVDGRALEVDFHWPAHRLIVETDGAAFHDNPLARARDGERDRLLTTAGWLVQRLCWTDVVDASARTIARLHTLLSANGR